MGKTYSNSKGSDRKIAKSMDELETLIYEKPQQSLRFQRKKEIMSINATSQNNRGVPIAPGKSNTLSAAVAAVATPVRVEPVVTVLIDGMLHHAPAQPLPGSGVVVEVKAHLNNAIHELEEVCAALKPVTAIIAVENPSREIPAAPSLPTVNKPKETTMTTAIKQPVLTQLEIEAIQAYRDTVAVAGSTTSRETTLGFMEEMIAGIKRQTEALALANAQSGYVPPAQYQPQQEQHRGVFGSIADKYDNMSTTGKVVTGVVVVAAVAAAGYYGYMAYKDYNVGYNDNIVNNDELV